MAKSIGIGLNFLSLWWIIVGAFFGTYDFESIYDVLFVVAFAIAYAGFFTKRLMPEESRLRIFQRYFSNLFWHGTVWLIIYSILLMTLAYFGIKSPEFDPKSTEDVLSLGLLGLVWIVAFVFYFLPFLIIGAIGYGITKIASRLRPPPNRQGMREAHTDQSVSQA